MIYNISWEITICFQLGFCLIFFSSLPSIKNENNDKEIEIRVNDWQIDGLMSSGKYLMHNPNKCKKYIYHLPGSENGSSESKKIKTIHGWNTDIYWY